MVHEGGYKVKTFSDGSFRFFQPDGKELLPAPSMPAATGDPVTALAEHWIRDDVTIDPWTAPVWNGDPCDYEWAISCALPRRRDLGAKSQTEANGS